MRETVLKFLLLLGIFAAPPLVYRGLLALVDLASIEWHQSGSLGYALFVFMPLWLIFSAWAVLFNAERSMKEHWRAFLSALFLSISIQSCMFWQMLCA